MEPMSVPYAPPARMLSPPVEIISLDSLTVVISVVHLMKVIRTASSTPVISYDPTVTAINAASLAPTMIFLVETPSTTTVLIAPLVSTMITPVETLSLVTASPLGIVDLEEELIMELIDNFYNSLRRCLLLVLKGMKTPFRS